MELRRFFLQFFVLCYAIYIVVLIDGYKEGDADDEMICIPADFIYRKERILWQNLLSKECYR